MGRPRDAAPARHLPLGELLLLAGLGRTHPAAGPCDCGWRGPPRPPGTGQPTADYRCPRCGAPWPTPARPTEP